MNEATRDVFQRGQQAVVRTRRLLNLADQEAAEISGTVLRRTEALLRGDCGHDATLIAPEGRKVTRANGRAFCAVSNFRIGPSSVTLKLQHVNRHDVHSRMAKYRHSVVRPWVTSAGQGPARESLTHTSIVGTPACIASSHKAQLDEGSLET